jgi:hypothetical protein
LMTDTAASNGAQIRRLGTRASHEIHANRQCYQ